MRDDQFYELSAGRNDRATRYCMLLFELAQSGSHFVLLSICWSVSFFWLNRYANVAPI
jgi:hypothetical protein